MQRREFLSSSAVLGAAAATVTSTATAAAPAKKFRLKYAPHFGMFRHSAGEELVDQLKFAADQGFAAWEDNGMNSRPVDVQEKLAQAMQRLGIEMGVFVANKISWSKASLATGSPESQSAFLKDIRESVDVARRVNAKWMTVVPGHVDLHQQIEYQTAHVVESLRRAAEIFEPHKLVMVLEPLNWWSNHPGMFLERIPQAYQICRAVDSPACKILFDIYHQQITEGNLIPNIDKAWEEIAYFQVGDNPGRKEPGTGEINYRNVFRHIREKGFSGIVGMEHGNSRPGKEGEQAVIDAYAGADDS